MNTEEAILTSVEEGEEISKEGTFEMYLICSHRFSIAS
jgi:hypothetical protein